MQFQRKNFKKLLNTLEDQMYKVIFVPRYENFSSNIRTDFIQRWNTRTQKERITSTSIFPSCSISTSTNKIYAIAEEFRALYYVSIVVTCPRTQVNTTDINIRDLEEAHNNKPKTFRVSFPCVGQMVYDQLDLEPMIEHSKIEELEFYYAFKINTIETKDTLPVKIMGQWYYIDQTNDIHTWKYHFDKNGNMTAESIAGIKGSKNIKRFHREPNREILKIGEVHDLRPTMFSDRTFNFSENTDEVKLIKKEKSYPV